MLTPDIQTTSVSEYGPLAQMEEWYGKQFLHHCNLQHRSIAATFELS